MTIKDKVHELKNKYKDYTYFIEYYRNREYFTSGPCTGKGSKGTHYVYTYHTKLKRNNTTLGEELFANSIEELEQMILKRINKETK